MTPEQFMSELGIKFNFEHHKNNLLEMLKKSKGTCTYIEYKTSKMNSYEIDAIKHFLNSCGIDFEFQENGYMQDEAFVIFSV